MEMCENCKFVVTDFDSYCPHCGSKVDHDQVRRLLNEGIRAIESKIAKSNRTQAEKQRFSKWAKGQLLENVARSLKENDALISEYKDAREPLTELIIDRAFPQIKNVKSMQEGLTFIDAYCKFIESLRKRDPDSNWQLASWDESLLTAFKKYRAARDAPFDSSCIIIPDTFIQRIHEIRKEIPETKLYSVRKARTGVNGSKSLVRF